MNFDHDLFLLLNFDGGTTLDRVMLTLSGTTMWLPLYALILWLVWRRNGWQRTLLFCVLILLAVALADMVAGIHLSNQTSVVSLDASAIWLRFTPMRCPFICE